MSEIKNIECPICMDDIDLKINCVTTECGHTFHTSCLMRNVAHNGYGCPYCRNALAEAVEDSDTEYETDEEEEEEEIYDDFALRGLRFFTNNLQGIEHDQEDILEEDEDAEEQAEAEAEEESVPKPTASFIAQKLTDQGITMEYLVKALLIGHEEYDDEEECVRVDEDLFGKFRIIISNYNPEQTTPVSQEVEHVAPTQQQEIESPEVDYSSQPKQYANITLRRLMTHV